MRHVDLKWGASQQDLLNLGGDKHVGTSRMFAQDESSNLSTSKLNRPGQMTRPFFMVKIAALLDCIENES